MAYFSRLTDIVTCNLTKLLEEADDPQAALAEIVSEMEAGLAGARRSMKTADTREASLKAEVEEHREKISHWDGKARESLQAGAEDQARLALVRRHEAENLVEGLEVELKAARETCAHLTRTYRALEARLNEAQRRQVSADQQPVEGNDDAPTAATAELDASLASEIDDELAALKRELGQS